MPDFKVRPTYNGTDVVIASDASTTNARTPTTHASSHSSGNSDPITHNNLAGLTTGDPHTQYAKKAGDTLTGAVVLSGDATAALNPVSLQQHQARAWKDPVVAATTANGTLVSAFENGDVIDGVTLATGNRILLKNQTTGAENGIYTVNASGAPTRATDADTSAKIAAGLIVEIQQGTTLASQIWRMTNTISPTLNTTALTFGVVGVSSVDGRSGTVTLSDLYAAAAHVGAGGTAHANAIAAGAAGFMTGSDKSKLDGIEAAATADMTASEILTAVKTVDGSGSGLDADTLDGTSSAGFAASTHATSHNLGGSDVIYRYETKTFTFKGTLPTANGTTSGTLRVPIRNGITPDIVNVTGTINVNPTGAGSSQTLDIRRSGTSIYSSAAKISFVPSGSQYQSGATPDTVSLTGGTHYLTVDLVTAGSPSAGGSDIVLDITYRY